MKPNADVSAEATLPSGDRVRWDPASPDPKMRPTDIGFETASGTGFATGNVTFARPTDITYSDLRLLNEIKFYTAAGREIYSARVEGAPVGDTWQMNCSGWMESHGGQRPFTELLVERDFGQWGEIALGRRAGLLFFSQTLDKGYTASNDHALKWTGESAVQIPANSRAELAYTAPPGSLIRKVFYEGSQSNDGNVYAPVIISADEDQFSNGVESPVTFDDTLRSVTLEAAKRSLILGATSNATHTPVAGNGFSRTISAISVVGDHGIPTIKRPNEPDGIAASDALRYLAGRYAPKLDTSGVQPTTYPIPSAVWREPTTFPDAAKDLNKYHQWRLGVWESRKLVFEPYDLKVADWQVRNGIDGVRVENVGDTAENVFNGAIVQFTDFSDVAQIVTPVDASDLRDTSDWIAANQWGDEAWLPVNVSWKCTRADAVHIGRLALAFANQASRPSTITVPRHIKDIHGHWHPSSAVRSDQTISVMNQHTPVPRLITGTSWRNHQLTITTNNAINSLEALQTRVMGALSANGLV